MLKKIITTASSLALATAASAHVTLEQPEAPAGSNYKAVLKVGHGCDGSATTRISVALPAGFRAAKPTPKAGWLLEVKREKLSAPYESHGRQVSDEVVEVSWTAKAAEFYLQDAWYDEFIIRGGLPASAGALWFKVSQTCVIGEGLWVEVPASGDSAKGLKMPAAKLLVVSANP